MCKVEEIYLSIGVTIPICMGYGASRDCLLVVYNGSMSLLLSSSVSLINTGPLLRFMGYLIHGQTEPLKGQNMPETALK